MNVMVDKGNPKKNTHTHILTWNRIDTTLSYRGLKLLNTGLKVSTGALQSIAPRSCQACCTRRSAASRHRIHPHTHTHTHKKPKLLRSNKTRQNGNRNVHLKFLFLNASLYLLNFIIYEFFYMSIMLWDIH